MITESIILAGGKGMRLRSIVSDVPKPMASIGKKPFLVYLLEYLISNHIKRVVLSVGYKHDTIINYFGNKYGNLEIVYAIEENPLGTGGAIRNALTLIKSSEVLVLNGDTYSQVPTDKLYYFYKNKSPDIVMLIRPFQNTMRYDTLGIDKNYIIKRSNSFPTFINSGMYIINVNWYLSIFPNNVPFSFEERLLHCRNNYKMIGVPDNNYFIDIGVTEDYMKANIELSNNRFIHIQKKSETLFLDRDGVINKKIINGYVFDWEKFNFIGGVKSGINVLSKKFKNIIIITNQQCIGKGLVSYKQVCELHKKMLNELNLSIDTPIFICPHTIKDDCKCRKPKIGLFKNAIRNDNSISFEHSIILGDSYTDILPAKSLGITSVYLSNYNNPDRDVLLNCNYIFNNLQEFAEYLG